MAYETWYRTKSASTRDFFVMIGFFSRLTTISPAKVNKRKFSEFSLHVLSSISKKRKNAVNLLAVSISEVGSFFKKNVRVIILFISSYLSKCNKTDAAQINDSHIKNK